METIFHWVVEGQLLLIEVTGIITLSGVIYMSQTGKMMLESSDSTVHIIYNLTPVTGVAPDMSHVNEILEHTKPFMDIENLGRVVAYGT